MPKNILFRLDASDHKLIRDAATEAGLTVQGYLELQVLGAIRPRHKQGPRPYLKPKNQKELPLTG